MSVSPNPSGEERLSRRRFLESTAVSAAAGLCLTVPVSAAKPRRTKAAVRTVLGPVAPETLGVTLMHEHAPIVDWSELYETKRRRRSRRYARRCSQRTAETARMRFIANTVRRRWAGGRRGNNSDPRRSLSPVVGRPG